MRRGGGQQRRRAAVTGCEWVEVRGAEQALSQQRQQQPFSPCASAPCDGCALPPFPPRCALRVASLPEPRALLRFDACQPSHPRACACDTLHGARVAAQLAHWCALHWSAWWWWVEHAALRSDAGRARVERGWSAGGAPEISLQQGQAQTADLSAPASIYSSRRIDWHAGKYMPLFRPLNWKPRQLERVVPPLTALPEGVS